MDGQPTFEGAIGNAARILQFAEGETDLAKMKTLTDLADSWLVMAGMLGQHADRAS